MGSPANERSGSRRQEVNEAIRARTGVRRVALGGDSFMNGIGMRLNAPPGVAAT